MNTLWVKIIPNDTLFFRSARPFTMGSETWADIIFPPSPSTFYGAIRTLLIFSRGTLENFKKGYSDIGNFYEKGSMEIKGPFLFTETTYGNMNIDIFFKSPQDLINVDAKKHINLTTYSVPKLFISDGQLFEDKKVKYILTTSLNTKVEDAYGYINSFTMKDYLSFSSKKIKEFYFYQDSQFYLKEEKIGIARDRHSKASKEGYLYRTEMIRLNNSTNQVTGFLLKINNVENFPKEGHLKLGGEGKTVLFKVLEEKETKHDSFSVFRKDQFEEIDINIRQFKLYFVTNAIFEKGWLPKWIDEKTFLGEFKNLKLRLTGCCLGKFEIHGGWDIAKKQPKPVYKVVPQASVYYFELLEETKLKDVLECFHFQNISDINKEEGFGLVLVGGING